MIVVKTDGCGFRELLESVEAKKPYDEKFHDCMLAAAKATVLRIRATLAYVTADEAIFLLPEVDTNFQRALTMAAAQMTLTFSRTWEYFHDPADTIFRATAFRVENPTSFLLKHRGEYEARFLQSVGRLHFSHADLLGRDRQTRIAMLKGIGVDFNTYPQAQRCGIILKAQDSRVIVDTHISPFTLDYLC